MSMPPRRDGLVRLAPTEARRSTMGSTVRSACNTTGSSSVRTAASKSRTTSSRAKPSVEMNCTRPEARSSACGSTRRRMTPPPWMIGTSRRSVRTWSRNHSRRRSCGESSISSVERTLGPGRRGIRTSEPGSRRTTLAVTCWSVSSLVARTEKAGPSPSPWPCPCTSLATSTTSPSLSANSPLRTSDWSNARRSPALASVWIASRIDVLPQLLVPTSRFTRPRPDIRNSRNAR